MKTNKELVEWVDDNQYPRDGNANIPTMQIRAIDVRDIFRGMKLVPEDSVVLSKFKALVIHDELSNASDAMTMLDVAIQEAKGAKKDD